MPTRFRWSLLPLSLSVLLPLVFASVVESLPGEAPPSQATATPTPSASIFIPQVSHTPLEPPAKLPQDVAGAVINRDGKGVPGVQLKVTSPGWEATTTTIGDGVFHFTLGAGSYTIQLVRLPSQPASIIVDGKTRIRVEFRERAVETPTVTPTPTVAPTATPTATPIPKIESPTIIPLYPSPTASRVPPKPSPTPSLGSALPEFNPTPWIYAFLTGGAFAGLVFALLLLISLMRR